jgi:hypothetical protein
MNAPWTLAEICAALLSYNADIKPQCPKPIAEDDNATKFSPAVPVSRKRGRADEKGPGYWPIR